jgi:hypothetical protein
MGLPPDDAASTGGTTPALRPASDVRTVRVESESEEREQPLKLHALDPASEADGRRTAPELTHAQDVPIAPVDASVMPIRIRPSVVDQTPAGQPRRPRPSREVERSPTPTDASRVVEAPRAPVIEPALAPTVPLGQRGMPDERSRTREFEVRIGTIEIYAEPGPAPGSAAPAAAPVAAARPQGGFDEFVRLRTYAPWER